MTITESTMDRPPTTGTHVYVSFLLGPASEVAAIDNGESPRDLVVLRFDTPGCGNTVIQGDLATVQRIVDEAARQLMLVSTARAAAEDAAEDERERQRENVESLRERLARSRADAYARIEA